jgi:BolA protein
MTQDRTAAIRARLEQALQPRQLDIEDDSQAHAGHVGAQDGGGHFNVSIVSAAFAGKSLVQRHRMVYDALGEMMQADIHALSIKALTPEEL